MPIGIFRLVNLTRSLRSGSPVLRNIFVVGHFGPMTVTKRAMHMTPAGYLVALLATPRIVRLHDFGVR